MCNVQVVGGETWDQRPDQPASTAVLSCQFDWNNTTVGCRLPHLLQLDLPCPALLFYSNPRPLTLTGKIWFFVHLT